MSRSRWWFRPGSGVLMAALLVGLGWRAVAAGDPPEQRTIRGRVMSRYGPVGNARVRLPGAREHVLTDKLGRFELQTAHRPGLRLRVTAGKQGWFNNAQVSTGTGRTRDIFLNPVYLNDQPGYRFTSPNTCSRCHVKLTRYWNRSKMAKTTSNPKVADMFYGTDALKRPGVAPGYRLDNPDSNGNCVLCHAPSAAASSPRSVDLKGALRSRRTEWNGISCDYCHKIRKVLPDKTRPSGWAGVLERQSSATSPSILVFGPYDDVVVGPMAASYNRIYDQGLYCATCHSHRVRLKPGKTWNPQGVYEPRDWKALGQADNSIVPVQTTYQEWKLWQDGLAWNDPNKGKKCQTCHMSWRKEMLPYDHYVVDDGARRMWGTYRSPQDIRPHHFDGGTEIQLKTALAMELDGEILQDRLRIQVDISNTNGGHWVPTGEPMRSVILLVEAVDSQGKPLKLLDGGTLPAWTGEGDVSQGDYAGLPGAVFARILGDDAGNLHVPFWQATRVVSDNRIRPKQSLRLDFDFALQDAEDEPSVEAKLIYRPVVKPLAQAKKWQVGDIVITTRMW